MYVSGREGSPKTLSGSLGLWPSETVYRSEVPCPVPGRLVVGREDERVSRWRKDVWSGRVGVRSPPPRPSDPRTSVRVFFTDLTTYLTSQRVLGSFVHPEQSSFEEWFCCSKNHRQISDNLNYTSLLIGKCEGNKLYDPLLSVPDEQSEET